MIDIEKIKDSLVQKNGYYYDYDRFYEGFSSAYGATLRGYAVFDNNYKPIGILDVGQVAIRWIDPDTLREIQPKKEEQDKYVKAYMGNRLTIIPLEEYLDIKAMQNGFDDYQSMLDEGYRINIPALYDEEGNLLKEDAEDKSAALEEEER